MWCLHERHHSFIDLLFRRYDALTSKTQNGEPVVGLLKGDKVNQKMLEDYQNAVPPHLPFFMIVERLDVYKSPVVKKDNTEYQKRLQKLREEQQEKEYKQMTMTVDTGQRYGRENLMENFGQELRSANRHLIVVFNTLLTVGGAFVFGFFGIDIAYPHLNLDMTRRMIIGLVLGTIVFFADLYFIVKALGDDIESTNGQSTTVASTEASTSTSSEAKVNNENKKSR
ncbi:hypothetical protein QR680_011924 [Steinernema hermaphroditum]|uniref:Transmembrane protein 199 n=1 Tax=Steinernema hermaphroditum TaxID=289476 RepID=A0AA39LYW9_9BILA|nr:hypothetical protein QR680_011924 [Steinernema hermaphroditum]